MRLRRRAARIPLQWFIQILHLVEHLLDFLCLEAATGNALIQTIADDCSARRHSIYSKVLRYRQELGCLLRVTDDQRQLWPRHAHPRVLITGEVRRATHLDERLAQRVAMHLGLGTNIGSLNNATRIVIAMAHLLRALHDEEALVILMMARCIAHVGRFTLVRHQGRHGGCLIYLNSRQVVTFSRSQLTAAAVRGPLLSHSRVSVRVSDFLADSCADAVS